MASAAEAVLVSGGINVPVAEVAELVGAVEVVEIESEIDSARGRIGVEAKSEEEQVLRQAVIFGAGDRARVRLAGEKEARQPVYVQGAVARRGEGMREPIVIFV